MKTFFNKKQAISVLLQIEKHHKNNQEDNPELDVFAPVDVKHKYFSLSCEDIEKKLAKYLHPDGFAGVIEQSH